MAEHDADAETETFTVDGPGGTDEVTLPAGLVDLFNEAGDPDVEVVADVLQTAFTSRAHMLVHHSEGEVEDHVREAEEAALALFEERFGQSFGEATGHDH